MRAYWQVLSRREARLLALVMLPVRLGYAMAALSLVLLAADRAGSFSAGGAALGLFSLGAGALGPVRGALVDRFGQTRPLVVYLPVFCAGFVMLTVIDSAPLLLGLSFVAGAMSPPLLASSRPLWRTVVPDHLVRTAFALDSTSMQATQILGPALAGFIAVQIGPSAAMVTVGVLVMVGGTAFVAMPASRRWTAPPRESGYRQLLASPGLTTPLALGALSGVIGGALVVALPALSAAYATPFGAGFLLALTAAGSVIGGAWAGTRHPQDRAAEGVRVLLGLSAALVPAAAAAALVGGGALVAVPMLVVGLMLGPAAVLLLELVDRLAPIGAAVTAFAGIVAIEGATVAFGAVAAGLLVDADLAWAALLVAAACAAAGAAVYWLRRASLRGADLPTSVGLPGPKLDQCAAASHVGPIPTETSSGTSRA